MQFGPGGGSYTVAEQVRQVKDLCAPRPWAEHVAHCWVPTKTRYGPRRVWPCGQASGGPGSTQPVLVHLKATTC